MLPASRRKIQVSSAGKMLAARLSRQPPPGLLTLIEPKNGASDGKAALLRRRIRLTGRSALPCEHFER
jgi:hypothetical protein